MEEHRTARQRERVDLSQIHDVERVPKTRLAEIVRNLGDESLTDPFDEVARQAVVDHRQLSPDVGRRLPAKLHILFGREAIAVRLDARLRGNRHAHRERSDGRNQRSVDA